MSARIPSAEGSLHPDFLAPHFAVHVELPSGAMASVSNDAPPELLSAMDTMVRHVQAITGSPNDQASDREGGSS